MREVLKNLYFGNIRPSERQMASDSELQREINKVSRCEQRLREQLDGTAGNLLSDLVKAQHEIDSITACENFILGFRLGVRLMAECMDEDDGDMLKIVDGG